MSEFLSAPESGRISADLSDVGPTDTLSIRASITGTTLLTTSRQSRHYGTRRQSGSDKNCAHNPDPSHPQFNRTELLIATALPIASCYTKLTAAGTMARKSFYAALLAVFICTNALAAEQTGIPYVGDGDTITIANTKIRLQGIDAPETDQICLDESGARWTCGIEARNRLAAHIGSREVRCRLDDVDRYGRSLARCTVDGQDLNEWMVREGWALAYVQYSRSYVEMESDARANRRGLWRGAFVAPWDWRHRTEKTVVLGALSVPVSAKSELLAPASSAGSPSPECIIKGNFNRSGERIYHTPGQFAYSQIDMTKGAN